MTHSQEQGLAGAGHVQPASAGSPPVTLIVAWAANPYIFRASLRVVRWLVH